MAAWRRRQAGVVDSCAAWRMQALFARGAESGPLVVFLANAPGEHGLKQAARTIDAALSGAHSSLAVALRGALQGVAFLLDELAGLLRSSPAYDGLGLEVRRLVLLCRKGSGMQRLRRRLYSCRLGRTVTVCSARTCRRCARRRRRCWSGRRLCRR